jgi:hypothetical protein
MSDNNNENGGVECTLHNIEERLQIAINLEKKRKQAKERMEKNVAVMNAYGIKHKIKKGDKKK